MKFYDISQEVFSCVVYPGDPYPEKQTVNAMENGDLYNLSMFSMCAHNGTHIDTPRHFFIDGATVEQIPLSKYIGMAYVVEHEGDVTADDAKRFLKQAKEQHKDAASHILIKGNAVVTESAAHAFADAGIDLVGNESQTVGPEDGPMAVHKILLSAGVILLEGIRLQHVPQGVYLLNAAPLNLSGCEGAPCRAILIDEE